MFFSSNTSSGPAPPSSFAANGGTVLAGGGNTFTLGTFNVPTGNSILLAFTIHGNSGAYCGTISGVTGNSGGDTFTQISSSPFVQTQTCVSIWKMWTPTPNAAYTVVMQGNGSSPAGFIWSALTFNPGTLTGTMDGGSNIPCSGGSNAATAIQCSSAMSPSGTLDLAFSASATYDDLTSPTDNSSPAFTIPSGGIQHTTSGSVIISYAVANPVSGTYKPGVQSAGLGDWIVIGGVMFQ